MSVLLILGIQLAIVGVILFAASPAINRRWPGSSAALIIVRTVVLIGGLGLAGFDLVGGATPMSGTPNPVPLTVTSVDAGNALYQANCAACHGVSGAGGGPLAGTTQVTPPSLLAHLGQHSDGDLFYWISNGMPGGMPAWASKLSESDRWNLINYLRSINGANPVGASTDAPPDIAAFVPFGLPLVWAVGFGAWLASGFRKRPLVRTRNLEEIHRP